MAHVMITVSGPDQVYAAAQWSSVCVMIPVDSELNVEKETIDT